MPYIFVFIFRQNEIKTELIRTLEKAIKETQCIDTESLCIMAGSQVCHENCQY